MLIFRHRSVCRIICSLICEGLSNLRTLYFRYQKSEKVCRPYFKANRINRKSIRNKNKASLAAVYSLKTRKYAHDEKQSIVNEDRPCCVSKQLKEPNKLHVPGFSNRPKFHFIIIIILLGVVSLFAFVVNCDQLSFVDLRHVVPLTNS